MEAQTLSGEAPETRNLDTNAKPIYPTPAFASQSRTFFEQSERPSPPLSRATQIGEISEIGEFRVVLRQIQHLTLQDLDQKHATSTALDSLLHDMETGKETSDIRAPHDYRKSMVSLSDQSLIPNPVKARKSLEPQTDMDKTDDKLNSKIADLNAAQPDSPPLPTERSHNTPHDCREYRLSAYSASVYSEDSLPVTHDGRSRNRESYSSPESRTKNPDAKEASNDVLTEKQAAPVESYEPTASPELLTSRSLKSSEPISVRTTSDSPTHETITIFLEESLSKPKQSTLPPAPRESQCKGEANESGSDEGSAFVSSGSSSDNVADTKIVRSHPILSRSAINNSSYRSLPTL
jgi:hypothetical protein